MSRRSLTSLARSGVLLLNTSLTVKPHQAGAHSGKGWETFTDKIVDLVDRYGGSGEVGKEGKGVVVLAWGAWAAKRVAKMDKKKHLILTSPVRFVLSPLSDGVEADTRFVSSWLASFAVVSEERVLW